MAKDNKLPKGFTPTNYAKDTCKTGFDAKNLGSFAKDKGNSSNHNSSRNSKKY